MPDRKGKVGRPRIWTDEEVEIAFSMTCRAAAERLGRTEKAVEQLRARVRYREAEYLP